MKIPKLYLLSLLPLMCSVTFAQSKQEIPTPPSRPIPSLQETKNIDTVLKEKVQAKIASIPMLKGQSVTAGSYDQIITIQGSVDNKTQEQAAIEAAKSVPGVKEVHSELTIKLN